MGKIDRIDKIGNEFQIIDYKLNKDVFTTKEVGNSLQLSFYALIFFYLTGMIPSKVGFYFLRCGKLIFTKKDKKDIEKTRDLIDYVARKITREEFHPKESKTCQRCDYKEYCSSMEAGPTWKAKTKRQSQLIFPL